MSIKEMTIAGIPPVMKRLARRTLRSVWSPPQAARNAHEPDLREIAAGYDVIMMKHCFPASDVLEDTGNADSSSPRQSLENYQAVYRELRKKFDEYPEKMFILWTLPPRHRLFDPDGGDKNENAARATAFSNWLKADYLTEEGTHPNIFVWDFRGLMTDPGTNFLRYEFEINHRNADSHPNRQANNMAGPKLAEFIADSVGHCFGDVLPDPVRIIFMHHSTGRNVYQYTSEGLPARFERINSSGEIIYKLASEWYPADGNMPVHYYRKWVGDRQL